MTLDKGKARAKARDLIKESEGLVLMIAPCPAGYMTGGWGHRTNERGLVSLETAKAWLEADIDIAVRDVGNDVAANCNTNQLAALLSFVFNIGGPQWIGSTIRRMILSWDMQGAEAQFRRWNKHRVAGRLKVSRGLVIRREAEATLFACDRDL